MSSAAASMAPVVAAEPTAHTLYLITNDFTLPIPVRLTLGQFREWATSDEFPESLPVHFVEQEVYLDMSNEELATYVLAKGEIQRVVANLNVELDLGKFFPDGALVTNIKARVSNNPDAALLTWETLKAKRARLVPRKRAKDQFREIEGSPDWVLEVVSMSSVQKDTVKLRRAYHRGEIREYWLVDARGAEITFQILLWRKRGYVTAPSREGWQYSELFGRWFRFARKRDRLGFWAYQLEVKAN